jgi:ubiquinone biosynthesis protein
VTAAAARPLRADESPSTIRRVRETVAVLVRHGLADVVDALHLGRYTAIGARLLPVSARMDPTLSRPERVRLTLEELGPTFVKFGQALSVRADLVPPEYARELAALQERVAPLEPGAAEAAIEAELGQPVSALFASFDPEPVAAASIAQVHRAVLRSGDLVAVKVRRPGIGRTIAGDIEMLRHLARLVDRYVPAAAVVDPVGTVEEFARTIKAEQDLVREARNIETCARNFEGDATVRVPRVHWDLTTPAVLTTEFLEGVKVAGLDAAAVGPFARSVIARRGASAILKQVLTDGFFHADPHPGNLLILPGHVIGFLDFGIVGQVDEGLRRDLARIIRAIWQRDAAELARLAVEIADPQGELNARALETDLAGLIEKYGNVPIGDLAAAEVLTDVVAVARRHRLRMPANLMLLIKALVTIEGVGVQLDPGFRVVEHAAPLAERLWKEEHSPAALGRRVVRDLHESVEALREIPRHVEAIGRKIREGRLEIRFVHRNLDHFVKEMDRSSNRIAFALIIAALIVGSSLIIQGGRGTTAYGYPMLGLAGFLVAGLFGIGLAIGIVRSGRL